MRKFFISLLFSKQELKTIFWALHEYKYGGDKKHPVKLVNKKVEELENLFAHE